MTRIPLLYALLAALSLGVAQAMAFAPWGLPWLQVLALAGLFALSLSAKNAKAAAALGFAFGMGWFGVGVSWVYVSMHEYGLMPAVLAGLATAAFCAFLSLYPALALGFTQRFVANARWRLALALPASFALAEWLRGSLFTGFPWLAIGYAHTDGPLAGFAPLMGVYGIGLMAAVLAGALALFALPIAQRGLPGIAWTAGIVALVLGGGMLLSQHAWTEPMPQPLAVRLVQGNVPQDQKFTEEGLAHASDVHLKLMTTPGPKSDLIVLPESVFPAPLQLVPTPVLRAFESAARERSSDLVFGVFLEEPPQRYFNSAVAIAPGSANLQTYSKRHLVPFGEFIPFGFRWFVDLMQMPIGDQEKGAHYQAPMLLAGQRVALNICYEDLFGEEIITAFDDPALAPTILLNISNLAWFDDSLALPQHLQISRMRALETGRPMLRATNTGATAAIDFHGHVIAQLPYLQAAVLDVSITGAEGTTPYVRFGNTPALLLAFLALAAALVFGGKGRAAQAK